MLLIDIFSDPRNLLCWFCDKKPLILRALRTITSAPAQLWIISQNMTHNTISQKQNIPPPNWFPEEIEIQVGLPPRRWAIFLPISWLDLRFVMTQWCGSGHLISISPGQLQIITALLRNDWHWHKYEYPSSQLNMNLRMMMMTGMFYRSPPLLSYHKLTDSCWWTPLRMLVLLLMASQLSRTKPLKISTH